MFLSLNFCFDLWHLYKSLLSSMKGLSIYFYAFLFFWVSIFSYKAPTREHYDHTCALDVANIQVCFMNGSMSEHDGLVITFFSVDILKDMVACWYAWVLMYSDYCVESSKSPMSMLEKKIICDEHVRQHSTSEILFLSFTYLRTSMN